ncbi:MAG: hydroxysqualene dehydroxylase HpnE [Pseudomonadota bacterium]|nr:hydroxysqualene dehydroxylase HpnE [Pseudomonadota bacterium]
MTKGIVHIIGAGLAGLAAAVRLSAGGADVILHEAAAHAGGRCRSYFDPVLGITIDNGNHVVLSGNTATLDYLRTIGAEARLADPGCANFPFFDLASHERWSIRPNRRGIPWWIFATSRRVPGTRAAEYLAMWRLLRAPPDQPVGQVLACSGLLYDRLWRPLLLAALNTEPATAAAGLASATMRGTLVRGGRASRPLIPAAGLSEVFVAPALEFLQARGGAIRYGHRLRAMNFGRQTVGELDFGDEGVRLAPDDRVVLAVPPWVAVSMVPGLEVPTEFRAIVNAHFLVTPPRTLQPMIGVVNGTIEWIFCFRDRLAVTISAADRLLDVARSTLAGDLWREVAAVTGMAASPVPAWQIIKERRATFAALPKENAKRPPSTTQWANLVLAGDWIQTGLPATIEGAIRSGNCAADHAGWGRDAS